MWRDVARRFGKIERWTYEGRSQVCIAFWVEGRRVRIYSDVDRWGRHHRLTEDTAKVLLDDIRAEIRHRRSIEEALAPFLGTHAPENLFSFRWHQFLEQKRRDLFTTLQEFQEEQVAELIEAIAPKAESFNEQIRAIVQAWNSEAAPLLKQLAQIDQTRTEGVYFEQLSLGETDLRSLKTLRAFPTIIYRPQEKRFDFFLEVIA